MTVFAAVSSFILHSTSRISTLVNRYIPSKNKEALMKEKWINLCVNVGYELWIGINFQNIPSLNLTTVIGYDTPSPTLLISI